MSNDRRLGDLVESASRAIALAFAIPIIAAVIGGLGMVLASILAIPFYFIFWIKPEELLQEHPVLCMALWVAGMLVVFKTLLPNASLKLRHEFCSGVGVGVLVLLGAAGLALVIAGGLAFLAHCDVEWAKSALLRD